MRERPGFFSIAWQVRQKGQLRFFLDQWAAQGDLPYLEIWPRKLRFVIHPEHLRQLYSPGQYDKLHGWGPTREFLLGDGLIASRGELWKRQRRLMSTFFTPRSIEQYYSVVLEASQALAQRWERLAASGEVIDMTDEMTRVTASIILRAMFGADVSDERLRAMEGDVHQMVEFLHYREMVPVRPPLWAPVPIHRRYLAARARVRGLIQELIERRRAQPQASWPNDLLSKLMSARDEETGAVMSDALLQDEALGIFVAGHETTAHTLASAWWQLHDHPHVAARLHEELDAVVTPEAPTLAELKQLPYTVRVIKEVLRLFPPSPAGLRNPVGEQQLGGERLPADNSVILFTYATHRHPAFWPEPERFDPDRFLPEQEQARHPYAYVPFGAGQRICLGNHFAMLEASLLIALLARRFQPKLVAGHRPVVDSNGVLLIRNGLPMVIERRGEARDFASASAPALQLPAGASPWTRRSP